MSVLLAWHLPRLWANYYGTSTFQRLALHYTTVVLLCKKVLLFLDSAVEQADADNGREPYLAWNWELADLTENEEMYKEF